MITLRNKSVKEKLKSLFHNIRLPFNILGMRFSIEMEQIILFL